MHFPLPAGHGQHETTLSRAELERVLPHSTHLGADSLGEMAFDPEKGIWLRGEEALPRPFLVLLDGSMGSMDGDHRLYAAYRSPAESVPVLLYDLQQEADARAGASWRSAIDEQHYLRYVTPAQLESMGGPGSYAPERFRDYVRDLRRFASRHGIEGFHAFDDPSRILPTKAQAQIAYETLRSLKE